MRKLFIALFLTMFLFVGTTFSQTFNVSVYTDTKYDLKKSESSFGVRDAYLGVSHIFDVNWNGGVNLKYDGETVNLYTADVSYFTTLSKDLDLHASVGRLESKWFTYTNTLWNNYFISSVISEQFKDRTIDGASFSLVNKNVVGTVEVFNSTSDKRKQATANIFIIPTENLTFGGYYSIRPEDSLNSNNKFGFMGYYAHEFKKIGTFNVGAEYGRVTTDTLVSNVSTTFKNEYISVYGEYQFKDKSPFSLIARYDIVNTDNKYITAGINYTPNQYLKLGLNVRNSYDINSITNKSYNTLYFNAGFNF